MLSLKYNRLSVIYLCIGGLILPQAWAEPGGIQEGTIELPMGKAGNKVQNFTFPNATGKVISEENIPLSGGNDGDFKQSAADAEIQVPENPEQRLAEKQIGAQERAEANYLGTSASKLGGGMLDIVTSWLELPKTIAKITQEEGLVSGLTVGLAKGIANTAEQAVSGAVNVATFPVPKALEIDMVENAGDEFSMEETFGAAFKKGDAD